MTRIFLKPAIVATLLMGIAACNQAGDLFAAPNNGPGDGPSNGSGNGLGDGPLGASGDVMSAPKEAEVMVEAKDKSAPVIEEIGDTLRLTTADGHSQIVITQDGGAEAETELTQEGDVTILRRRGDSGGVTIVQGGGGSSSIQVWRSD